MIERILERLFGNEIYGQREEIEELKATMGIEKPLEKKTYDDPDLQTFADAFGELQPGKEITLELGEAAKFLGRKGFGLMRSAASLRNCTMNMAWS